MCAKTNVRGLFCWNEACWTVMTFSKSPTGIMDSSRFAQWSVSRSQMDMLTAKIPQECCFLLPLWQIPECSMQLPSKNFGTWTSKCHMASTQKLSSQAAGSTSTPICRLRLSVCPAFRAKVRKKPGRFPRVSQPKVRWIKSSADAAKRWRWHVSSSLMKYINIQSPICWVTEVNIMGILAAPPKLPPPEIRPY